MDRTAHTHGMQGELVEPDWPPLTLPELRDLLASFDGCGEPIRIISESPRPLSSAGVVATARGKVFVKRHHGSVRNVEGLLEEHRFLAHLHAAGAPVPRLLADRSGRTAIASGPWTYEVHEVPAAMDLYQDALSWTPFQAPEHAFSAGQILARLHLASQSFHAPRRGVRPLIAGFTIFAAENPRLALREYLAVRPALANHAAVRQCADQALTLLEPFHAQLLPLLPALPPLWTHNDLHASNLLWGGAGPSVEATHIIDFGLADRTIAVHDLAHALERNIVEWLTLVRNPRQPERVAVHLDHLRALLSGYESVRPLSAEEAAALAPMAALCHAEFALSEADYFLAVLHSEESARMAYDGWLVGHARWFRSQAGQSLLSALADWAGTPKRARGKATHS